MAERRSKRSVRIGIGVVAGLLSVGSFASATTAQATESVWDNVGYVPTITPGTAAACATAKMTPWPMSVGATLDPTTHVVHEHVSVSKPSNPCAFVYYVHHVSIVDNDTALPNSYAVQASLSASQDVPYTVNRVGQITFEIVTGSGQGDLQCQTWKWTADYETQPVEVLTYKGVDQDC